ncbi:hypothetical protein SAICODRAFT_111905 [Saitoella complicata NRRL Y-17804]|uniref:uncharacterized protein n=1 Tax=Saitoella complicata (strain BCRC 22490 / CBS 7301 / JCM 7358 / NBRC 10748 / NRRL Y-17804) TaxID=698492 RepID=UPI000867DDFD|nr:uncharacterized protein SAICODRAFT_111905 [Saitoella complicata NRRL Y-17804]ODQ53307.1 hypothetical protein SAICODRAFT_111905 [Saitoella complicata NRRL Y-17804]
MARRPATVNRRPSSTTTFTILNDSSTIFAADPVLTDDDDEKSAKDGGNVQFRKTASVGDDDADTITVLSNQFSQAGYLSVADQSDYTSPHVPSYPSFDPRPDGSEQELPTSVTINTGTRRVNVPLVFRPPRSQQIAYGGMHNHPFYRRTMQPGVHPPIEQCVMTSNGNGEGTPKRSFLDNFLHFFRVCCCYEVVEPNQHMY